MKKTLSLVLALVMLLGTVPAFAATPSQEAGAILQELGVLQGYNGDLMLEKELNRQDSVIMLSRLLGVEEIAEKYSVEPTWKDVAFEFYVPYLGWAQDNGYFKGHSADKFGFGETITVQDYSLVLLRALGYVDTPWEAAFALAKNLELVSGVEEKAKVTRGQMALMTVKALDTPVLGEDHTLAQELGFVPIEEALEMDAAVVGAKTLKVTFNKAVEDATITVRRGSITTNVSSTKWNEEKTEATLTTTALLTEGTYTVTVTGLDLEDNVKSLVVENEKVATLKFLGDNGVLTKEDFTEVQIGFQILNQYGEDVTAERQGTFTFSVGKGTPSLAGTGVLKITTNVAAPFTLNEKFAVTGIHAQTGTFGSVILTVSPIAKVSSVDIVGLYHPTDKVLRADEANWAEYKLIVEAKDQYGNKIVDPTSGVIAMSSNPYVTNIAAAFGTTLIDGKQVTTLALASPTATSMAGTSKITIISKSNGASDTFTLEVEATPKLDTLTIGSPDLAVAGEKVKLPVVAIDQFGNVVTSVETLNNALTGVSVKTVTGGAPSVFVKDSETGSIYLEVDFSAYVAAQPVNIAMVTANNKSAQLMFNLVAPAEATTISGIKDLYKAYEVGTSATVGAENLIVLDQYGREMESVPAFEVRSLNATFVVVDKTITAQTTGSATLVVELEDVAGSAYSFRVSAINATSIVSYVLDGPVKLWNGADEVDYELVGKTSSGEKVKMLPGVVSLATISNGSLGTVVETADGVKLVPTADTDGGSVTIGAWKNDTRLATIVVEISKVRPVATTVEFKDAPAVMGATLDFSNFLVVKDQYGEEIETPSGIWTSSDSDVATVNPSTGVATKVAAGTFRVGFVTTNGIVTTITVIVE